MGWWENGGMVGWWDGGMEGWWDGGMVGWWDDFTQIRAKCSTQGKSMNTALRNRVRYNPESPLTIVI